MRLEKNKLSISRRILRKLNARYTLPAIRSLLFAAIFMLYTLFPTPYPLFPIPYSLNSAYAKVESTTHNLSTSGPGPIKATMETQICIFCHTPHSAVTIPLWNHTLSEASYTLPSNTIGEWTALLSPQNQPDGDSRLCLSCHDGTVAIGSVVNLGGAPSTISMQDSGSGYLSAEGRLTDMASSFIGRDLSGHHPVSIEVNSALVEGKINQCRQGEVDFMILSEPIPPVKLRPTQSGVGVQCSSCHDAHDNTYGKFLRLPYGGAAWDVEPALCLNCHVLCE